MQQPSPSQDGGSKAESDAALMRAVAAGDRLAVAELYDRHASAVYGMARSMVRDDALAQDVSQETFVRLWTRAHMFDAQRGSPLAWLVSVTRNVALDELRRRRRALERAARVAADAAADGEGRVDLMLHHEWQSQRVLDAVAELSMVQRQTVELVYFQGFTLVEVADRLNVAVGTVKSRLHSALLSLRAALADDAAPINLTSGLSG